MTNEEAIKVLRTESIEPGGNAVSVCRFWEALDMAVKALDAVPVVRCRECKHRKYDDIFGTLWCNRDSCTKRVKQDDFCSYGEKRRDKDGTT